METLWKARKNSTYIVGFPGRRVGGCERKPRYQTSWIDVDKSRWREGVECRKVKARLACSRGRRKREKGAGNSVKYVIIISILSASMAGQSRSGETPFSFIMISPEQTHHDQSGAGLPGLHPQLPHLPLDTAEKRGQPGQNQHLQVFSTNHWPGNWVRPLASRSPSELHSSERMAIMRIFRASGWPLPTLRSPSPSQAMQDCAC